MPSTFMQVSLSVAEQGGWLNVQLRVSLTGTDELAWGLEHCSPHRRLRHAVLQRNLSSWQHCHDSGDFSAALALNEPIVELWGQVPFAAEDSSTIGFCAQIPDGLIARALLERIQQAEDTASLERDLRMLQLEAGVSVGPGDSADRSESLFEIVSAPPAVDRPAPVLPALAPADPVG